jgi:glycosyltransferase involved in cell wall biosynthesis
VPSVSNLRVHLGLHALQGEDPYRWFGLGRYARELALALTREHPGVIAGLEFDSSLAMPAAVEDFAGLGLLHQWPYDIRDLGQQDDFRIYHVLSPFSPWSAKVMCPPEFGRIGARLAVTLHDLIPWLYKEMYLEQQAVSGWYRARLKLVEAADLVIAVSHSAKDDAVRLLGIDPERIHVTHEAASDVFQRSGRPKSELLGAVCETFPTIRGPFIVYGAGAADPRKNVDGLVRAYAATPDNVRRGYQLVITGGTPAARTEEILTLAMELGVDGRVVLFGFASDETLRDLYQACALSVFPSFYEGFGLPVLEAMASGAPVVVSDVSSLPELVELPRARFDPTRPDDIARVITDVLTNESFHAELRVYSQKQAPQFTWTRTANATVAAYEWLASTSVVGPRSERPRRNVAICGRAGHQAPDLRGMAQHLVDKYDVSVDVVDHYSAPGGDLGVRFVNGVHFCRRFELGHYDAVLFVLDGSEADFWLIEPLRTASGTVWLRDVRLLPMYRSYYEHQGRDLTELPEELETWTSRYPSPESGILLRDELAQYRDSIYMLGEVTSQATEIIVGSVRECEIVELENGGEAEIRLVPRETWDNKEVIDAVCRRLLGLPERSLLNV